MHSCVEVRELNELLFGVVSAVGPGIGVLHGVDVLQGEKGVSGSFLPRLFEWYIVKQKGIRLVCETHTHTFYSSLDFVRDNPGELVPKGTFCHLLDFLVQNEDNTGLSLIHI